MMAVTADRNKTSRDVACYVSAFRRSTLRLYIYTPIRATYYPQALTPMAPATAEATAMMILRITSQVDFFMMLDF